MEQSFKNGDTSGILEESFKMIWSHFIHKKSNQPTNQLQKKTPSTVDLRAYWGKKSENSPGNTYPEPSHGGVGEGWSKLS